MTVVWSGHVEVSRNFDVYSGLVLYAIRQVAEYYKAVFEAYAKQNAPWNDQTGNARQTLHAWVEDLSEETVRLYLSHGMDYGVHLEVRHSGVYSIIWPTIQAHLEDINKMLQGIFAE